DDLELDFTFDVAATRVVRVVGFHFAQETRRFNATARTERSAAVAAARTITDAVAVAGAEARALSRAHATGSAGALARFRFRHLGHQAVLGLDVSRLGRHR